MGRPKREVPEHKGFRPPPGLRPAAVALREAQNSGLPCSSDRRAPDSSRQSADGCALWSRLETRYLRLPSPLRHNIFRQTRAPFGPHSDEDLRWRPGAPQACHFASVITNKLSEVDPQAAKRDWVTQAFVANHLGVSTRTVRDMTADGRLRAYRLNQKFVRYDLNGHCQLEPT